MITKLTANFSLEELIASPTAERFGFDQTPTPKVLAALKRLAEGMERVRAILGHKVIIVSSGYRCPALNAHVRGAKKSAHVYGNAADFNCYGYGSPLAICRKIVASDLEFDQIIQEGTWVHISFDPRLRREVLTKIPGGYSQGLSK